MRDRAQTKIRLDEIPAELCTRKEAMQMLGLKSNCTFGKEDRFKSLLFTYVVYKGKRIVLYNRKAVEALKYEPRPDGYLNAREVAKMLGYSLNNGSCYIHQIMQEYGVSRKLVKAHHPYYVWKREDVEWVKTMKTKTVPKGYISTKEASEILHMRSSYGTLYNLRKIGVKPIKGPSPNSSWYWKRKDVEKVKKMREKS